MAEINNHAIHAFDQNRLEEIFRKSNSYRIKKENNGNYKTLNTAHNWSVSFNKNGKTNLTPINATSKPYQIGINLSSINNKQFDRPLSLSSQNSKLSYIWGENTKEIWANDKDNLEQWFEIKKRPVQNSNKKLKINMVLTTDLSVELVNNSLIFDNRISYNKLKVWDKKGAYLPADMTLNDNVVSLVVDDTKAQYPITIDPSFQQQSYIKASNTGQDDRFGFSVAISGNTMVVGSFNEDSDSQGINSIETNDLAINSGAVYVFTRNNNIWSQQAYIKSSNSEASDFFGVSVAIDNDTLVVGAIGEASNATTINGNEADNSKAFSGAAYVFTRTQGLWSQQAYLKANNTDSDDQFGYSVSVHGDKIIVGAINEDSRAEGINGNGLDNGASNAGAAYTYVRSNNNWSFDAYLKPSNNDAGDGFGYSVAIYANSAAVGSHLEDSNLTGTSPLNTNVDNNISQDSGAVYVFADSTGSWLQQSYIKPLNTDSLDNFGTSVALFDNTLVVGSPFESSNATGINGDGEDNSVFAAGAAYVFVRSGEIWSQQAYLKASNTEASDTYGISVGLTADMVVVGARAEDSSSTGVNGDGFDNSASNSGAAYVYSRNGTLWNQMAYLKAPTTDVNDLFGSRVRINGSTVVVGVQFEDSNATGTDGNQADNSLNSSGAVNVFNLGYSVGGTVTGLANGNSFTVQNNGGDDLTISTNGSYSFAALLSDGSDYLVTTGATTGPVNQFCIAIFSTQSGTIAGADVTDANILCRNLYTVGGNLTGLQNGAEVVIQNNGATLTLNSNGSFVFTSNWTDGTAFSTTVVTQPTAPNQNCRVTGGNSANNDGTGVINGTDISNIAVACNAYPIIENNIYTSYEDTVLLANDSDGSINGVNNDSVLLNDSDLEGQLLSIVNPGTFTAGGIGGSLSINADGTFSYTPPNDLSGAATFNFNVSDGIDSSPSNLTINVIAVNDAPSFSFLPQVDASTQLDAQNTTLTVNNFISNIVMGPSDESNQQVLQINANIFSDTSSILNSIAINNQGTLMLDFSLNYGAAIVEVNLQDDGGTANNGEDTSQTEVFNVIYTDLIFKNDFESSTVLNLIEYLQKIQSFNTSTNSLLIDQTNSTVQFNGSILYFRDDNGKELSQLAVTYWLKEILVMHDPYGDFDTDGIVNFEDSSPFLSRKFKNL